MDGSLEELTTTTAAAAAAAACKPACTVLKTPARSHTLWMHQTAHV